MPTIQLTNNAALNLSASSSDGNATLNRYLTHPLTFITPAGFDSIVNQKVAGLDPIAFPFTAKAAATSAFAVEGTSLSIEPGISVTLGLFKGDDKAELVGSLQMPDDPASPGIVSFGLEGDLSAGDSATAGDFTFGITKGATISLTSFCPASAAETYFDAVGRAIKGLTIPHDVADVKSLPTNAICQVTGASSLQFSASVTYDVVNNPLATTSIPNLPSIVINATSGATVEATVTHTSDHTITVARLPSGLVHLSVSFTKTDDLETSLTVSTGLTATVGTGTFDALAFLLRQISPNSTLEMTALKANLPAAQAEGLSADIKAAIDESFRSSLGASLKAALEMSASKNRCFLYEIDLNALDAAGTAALASALAGDFRAITRAGAALAGIRELDSALTLTAKTKHSLAVHLLGIFNWGSTTEFVQKSKVDYTKDTHEIVLSDETIAVVGNNLKSDKLREVVLKGITLTLPASASTPAAKAPLTLQFFDREAATNPSKMQQFVNVLTAGDAPIAPRAQSLISQNLNDYGTSSLYLGLNLTAAQCQQLFIDKDGIPYTWTNYVDFACRAEAKILDGDASNVGRLKLFTAGIGFWEDLERAGARPNVIRELANAGIPQAAAVDVTALIWWSSAMANYAKALAQHQSLIELGKAVVKDGTLGFNEPWLVLTSWLMLGSPTMNCLFTSSLLDRAAVAAGAAGAPGN